MNWIKCKNHKRYLIDEGITMKELSRTISCHGEDIVALNNHIERLNDKIFKQGDNFSKIYEHLDALCKYLDIHFEEGIRVEKNTKNERR